MSSDSPHLPPASANEAAIAEQLTTEAEYERRQARRYRLLGWVFAIPAVLSLPCCVAGFSSELLVRQNTSFFVAITVLLLQAIVAPVAALMLFGTSSRHARRAARCVEATRPAAGGTDLLGDAKSSRRASLRLGWLWPLVVVWGLLGAAGLVALVVVGIDSPASLLSEEGLTLIGTGLFVVVGPACWLYLRISTLRRRAELMAECVRLGFGYREKPLKALLTPFARLPLFRRGGKATHLMQGALGGRALRIMEYGIPTGEHTEKRQTVVVVGLNSARVAFRLWPTSPVAAGVPSRVAGALKQTAATRENEFVPTDLPALHFTADDLEQRYWLFGRRENQQVLEEVLKGGVAAFLNKHPWPAVEAEDGLVAVYQPAVVWAPEDYAGRLEQVLALCDRLEKALSRQG